MELQEFTAQLDRAVRDEDYDRLFEAGLDDTSPETGAGRGVLRVTREADSLAEAIISVVEDAAKAGFRVVGIEDEDLVSLKTIAARTGRTYESLRLLATGKRGRGGFPAPFSGDGWALYSWVAVSDWFAAAGDEVPVATERDRIITAADYLLRARDLVPDLSGLAQLIDA